MGPLARLQQLPELERKDLPPALWRLLIVRILLATAGIKRTQRWLVAGPPEDGEHKADLATWQRRALAIKRVGARLPGVRCLARALCLCWWMRSSGIAVELRMGVRRDERGRVSGHAWVEHQARPVDETAETVARFQPIKWREAGTVEFVDQ